MSQGLNSAIKMTAKSEPDYPKLEGREFACSRLTWIIAVSLLTFAIFIAPLTSPAQGAALNPVGKVKSGNFSSRDRGKSILATSAMSLQCTVCLSPTSFAKTPLRRCINQAATICFSTLKMVNKSKRMNHA